MAAILAVAFIIWNCSGLRFPIFGASGRLAGRLAAYPKVALPPGAVVTRAVRVATRDPAEYYELTLPPGAVAPFVASVRAATKVETRDASRRWTMGDPPEWWTPQAILQAEGIEFYDQFSNSGYILYASPASPRVLLFWFAT